MKLFILFFSILFTCFLFPFSVSAHPLDEVGDIALYDQKQNLEIEKEESKLTIDLEFYSIEKIKVWESIDKNRDQTISEEEKNDWMKKGQESSWIEKDGTRYSFSAISLQFPEYYEFFNDTRTQISISFTSQTPVAVGDTIFYFYEGKDKKLSEIELLVHGKNGISVQNVEKQDDRSVRFTINEGEQGTVSVLGLETTDKLNSFLNTYVKVDEIPMQLLVFALLASFILGALHALTPGHGKALVAGYLVGEKGTVGNAIQLGIIVTITHTASVFILGVLALMFAEYIVATQVISAMNNVSGVLLMLFGLYLLITRLKNLSHHHVAHEHNAHDDHHHHSHHSIGIKNLLPLGISGGIVPCIDALAILVVALTLQKIAWGLLLLVVFSAGLAATLVLTGIIVVVIKDKVTERVSIFHQMAHVSGVLSALFVMMLGFLLIYYR